MRLLYRLGRQAASGVLTLSPRRSRASALSDAYTSGRAELFVLRRGAVVLPEGELAKRTLIARLARLVAEGELGCVFEGGAASAPPGAQHLLGLAGWARAHLEQQLDGSLAESLVRELAGIRLSIRSELAPAPDDEADKRMIAAMAQPRRLDQIWPLARTPRFRLLAFLHFLRGVDILEVEGIVAEQSAPIRAVGGRGGSAAEGPRGGIDHRRAAALRMLGVPDDADLDTVKRAYRRLARAIHPDLQPEANGERRRILERRFVEITAAYQALT